MKPFEIYRSFDIKDSFHNVAYPLDLVIDNQIILEQSVSHSALRVFGAYFQTTCEQYSDLYIPFLVTDIFID